VRLRRALVYPRQSLFRRVPKTTDAFMVKEEIVYTAELCRPQSLRITFLNYRLYSLS
jgi:hypothetical protein